MNFTEIRRKHIGNCLAIAVCAIFIIQTLCSCSWITAGTDDQEVRDLEKDMRAEKRTTVFEESLIKLGLMLKGYGVPETPVQSKNIGNESAEKSVPTDLYVMVSTTISKIGKPLVFIPYDVQYVVGETTTGGTIQRIYPKVVVTGGITGFDQDMVEKEREMEAEGGWAGASGGGRVSAEGGLSRVTIDLSMMDYKTQAFFSGVIISNSICLRKDKLGWGVFAYYMGNGASFDYSLKHKQGVHAALRTVVEFSMIELLGKMFEVPYWKCIDGAAPDARMMERIRDEFAYLPEDKQALKLKKMLFLHGCDVQKDVPVIQAFEEKIIRTEMNSRSCASMAELYVKLWETVPIERSSVRVAIEERYQQREDREKQRLVEAENKEKAVQAEQLKTQQAAALQSKINSFKANVASGDELFQKQKYDEAAGFYAKASELFPGEAYPQQRLKQIQEYKNRVQAESDRRAELNARAEQLFRAAEGAEFNQANYKQALQAVQAAMSADPGNKKTEDMYKTINVKLDKYKTVWGASKANEW
jgi:hypothetical protein